MKASTYMYEATRVTKTLGRKDNIEVRFVGDAAVTDSKVVLLPALAPAAELTTDQVMAMRGFVDHESAHIRHTDFKVIESIESVARDQDIDFDHLRNSFMALEDIRIEQLQISSYPGSREHLSHACSHTIDQYHEVVAKHPEAMHPENVGVFIGPVAVTWVGRMHLDFPHAPRMSHALSTIPSDLHSIASGYAVEALSLKSSKDALRLAIKLAKELATTKFIDPPEMSGPPMPVPGGKPEGEGEGDEEKGDGEEAKVAKQTHVDEVADGSEAEVDAKGSGSASRVGNIKTAGASGFKPISVEAKDVIEQIASEANEKVEASGQHVYIPVNTSNDSFVELDNYTNPHDVWAAMNHARRSKSEYKATGPTPNGDEALADLRKIFASEYEPKLRGMQRKLERFVLAERDRAFRGGFREGRLDSKRLVPAYQGQDDVFAKRNGGEDVDTEFMFVIDQSGSMSGHKMITAAALAYYMAKTLERIGAKVGVYGFSAGGLADNEKVIHELHDKRHKFYADPKNKGRHFKWGRCEKQHIMRWKPFNKTVKQCEAALHALAQAAGGNNHDGDSIETMYEMFKRESRARRRVMIVFSDGSPAGASVGASIEHNTKRVIHRIEDEGWAEIIGIGIMSDAVSHYYKKHVVCHDLDKFMATGMGTLAGMLLQGQNKKLAGAVTRKAAA